MRERKNRAILGMLGFCGALALLGVEVTHAPPVRAAVAGPLVSAPYLDKGLALISQQRLVKLGVKTKLLEQTLQSMKVYRLEVLGNRTPQQLSALQQRLSAVGYVFQLPPKAASTVATAPPAPKPATPPVAPANKSAAAKPMPAAPPKPAVAMTPPLPRTFTPAERAAAIPPTLPPLEGDAGAFAQPPAPKPALVRYLTFPLQLVDRLLARLAGEEPAVASQPEEIPAPHATARPRPTFINKEAPVLDRQSLALAKTRPTADGPEARYAPAPGRSPGVASRPTPTPARVTTAPSVSPETAGSLECQLARMASDLQREGFDVSTSAQCQEPVGYLVALYDDQDEATEMAQELRDENYDVVLVNRPDGKVEVRIDEDLAAKSAASRSTPSRSVRVGRVASEEKTQPPLTAETEGRSVYEMDPEADSATAGRTGSLSTLLEDKGLLTPEPETAATGWQPPAAPVATAAPQPEPAGRTPSRERMVRWEDGLPPFGEPVEAPTAPAPAPSRALAFERTTAARQLGHAPTALDPILARLPPTEAAATQSRPLARPEPQAEAPVEKRFYPVRPSFVPVQGAPPPVRREPLYEAPSPAPAGQTQEDIFDLLY